MNHERIAIDPLICHGKPCIKGTRIPMATVLSFLAGGWPIADILAHFPTLTADDVTACLSFAAGLADGAVMDILGDHAA